MPLRGEGGVVFKRRVKNKHRKEERTVERQEAPRPDNAGDDLAAQPPEPDIAEESLAARNPEHQGVGRGGRPRPRPIENE